MTTRLTHPNKIFMGFFLLMYEWGVLSTQHYAVGKFDFLLHLYVTFFVALGVIGWFWYSKIKNTAISVYGWLAFAIVLVAQPLLHHFDYADSLLFPIGIMLMASLIALIAVNMEEDQKRIAINWLGWGILIAGLLTVSIQLIQLFFSGFPSDLIMPLTGDKRLYGNIAQINQAAIVIILAMVSLFYLAYHRLSSLTHTKVSSGKKVANHSVSTRAFLNIFVLTILGMLILSTGLGFTSSRAGLIIVIIAIISTVFYPQLSKKTKIVQILVAFFLVFIGFQISHWLLSHFTMQATTASAVSRLATEDNGLRKSLLVESWLAFSQNPMAGIGWGNFALFGITHLDELPWLENANHAHNIIAQLAAEFGVLGLVCFLVLIGVLLKPMLKLFQGKLADYQIYSGLLLAVILLYSLSEFPLWYARFLFLSAFLVGMLDRQIPIKKMDIRGFGLIILVVYLLALPYYIKQYYAYLYVQNHIQPELGYNEQMARYSTLPTVYGYSKFQERMLFDIMLTDGNMGELKTALGQRVMTNYSYPNYIEKQAALLAFADQPTQASQLYHALCKHEYTLTKNALCPETIASIEADNVPNAKIYAQQTLEWAKNRLSISF